MQEVAASAWNLANMVEKLRNQVHTFNIGYVKEWC